MNKARLLFLCAAFCALLAHGAEISGAAPSAEPIKGGYHILSGLDRWYQSRGLAGKTTTGVGNGGIDIVWDGDSIMEGANGATYLWDKASHILKLKLQSRYNPIGVTGGYGYLPCLSGDSSSSWKPWDVWATSGATIARLDDNAGVGNRQFRLGVGANYARFAFDGTAVDAARKRLGVTDLEFVALQGSAVGVARLDVSSADAFVTPGAGDRATTTVNTTSGTFFFGKHWGRTFSGLSAANLNVIQFSGPSATYPIYADGVIAYNGDWDCGVRLHNIANHGTVVGTYFNTTGGSSWQALSLFGSAGTGASNMKLYLCDFITNDVGAAASPTVPVATFKANWTTHVQRVLALASKPSVLIVIPPCQNSANSLANYPAFVAALYQIADENPHVAVLDLWKFIDNDTYTGRVTELGWASSNPHYSDTAQEAWASLLFSVLTL